MQLSNERMVAAKLEYSSLVLDDVRLLVFNDKRFVYHLNSEQLTVAST